MPPYLPPSQKNSARKVAYNDPLDGSFREQRDEKSFSSARK